MAGVLQHRQRQVRTLKHDSGRVQIPKVCNRVGHTNHSVSRHDPGRAAAAHKPFGYNAGCYAATESIPVRSVMTASSNRRDFLKLGAGAGAAAWLGPRSALLAEPAKPTQRIRKAIMYATIGYKASVMEQFRAVKAAGFEGVEPMSHMNQKEVLHALEQTGLKAASVCCNTHWGKPLSHPDERMRQEGRE